MSINLPDLLWTIICFVLFMLVLNGLLLKPVLKTMDARKERIARAHELSEKRLAEEREAERAWEERRRQAREAALLEEKALVSAETERTAAELEAFASELSAAEEERVKALEGLASETDGVIAASIDRMAEAFTEKLISGGRS